MGCLMLNLLTAPSVFAEPDILLASNTKTDITDNPPQMHVEDEVQISAAGTDEEEGWFSRYKWWLLAGLVVVGGAAAAGGGGGGGSSPDNPTTPTTGNIQIDW